MHKESFANLNLVADGATHAANLIPRQKESRREFFTNPQGITSPHESINPLNPQFPATLEPINSHQTHRPPLTSSSASDELEL